jgi:hypothetical protein
VARGAGLRAKAKTLEEPPDPNVRAPALDPTDGRELETGPITPRLPEMGARGKLRG